MLTTSASDNSLRPPSGFEADFANPDGYEVNRSAECKVLDVWTEWKVGLNGMPSVESLEEDRKKDRKKIWWKSMNDYKYWSKQVRNRRVEYDASLVMMFELLMLTR